MFFFKLEGVIDNSSVSPIIIVENSKWKKPASFFESVVVVFEYVVDHEYTTTTKNTVLHHFVNIKC